MMDRIGTRSENSAFRDSTGDDDATSFNVAAASWVGSADNGISFLFFLFFSLEEFLFVLKTAAFEISRKF